MRSRYANAARNSARIVAVAAAFVVATAEPRAQHAVRRAVDSRPAAVLDLRTADGVRLVKGQWRYSDTRIIEADSKAYDYAPKAGAADFDDSRWEQIEPGSLEQRRAAGKLCFNWYRTGITIPERVGAFDTAGSTVVFEVVVDDYAEVWVDGRAAARRSDRRAARSSTGFNAPNRVVLTRDARPGQTIQLAIFGVNGPLSDPPSNFIWIRSATLDFYKPGAANAIADGREGRRESIPALDAIVPHDARIEKLAEGFPFTEGPVWVPRRHTCCSAIRTRNTIYRMVRRRRRCRCSGRRAGTPAPTSASTASPARTGSTLDRRAGSPSTSTAIAASRASRRTAR